MAIDSSLEHLQKTGICLPAARSKLALPAFAPACGTPTTHSKGSAICQKSADSWQKAWGVQKCDADSRACIKDISRGLEVEGWEIFMLVPK
jgi:hypothetical protein